MIQGPRSPIGAYLRAIGQLGADATTARAIAGMLGLAVADAEPSPVPVEQPLPPPVAPAPLRPPDPKSPRVDTVQEAVRPSTTKAGAGDLDVVRVADRATPRIQALPRLPPPRPFDVVALPFEPLLRRPATRSILSAAIAVRCRGTVLDVRRAIERIARQQQLVPPPWQLDPTTPGAIRVLVDEGPGMAQFARDAEDLAAEVAAVAGRDRTERIRMWQTPYAADDLLEPRSFPAVPRGAVIALSDLGIAPAEHRAPGIIDAWLRLDGELRTMGTRLVVFVPYPPARRPRRLAPLRLVTWDRSTSVAVIRRILRRSRSDVL